MPGPPIAHYRRGHVAAIDGNTMTVAYAILTDLDIHDAGIIGTIEPPSEQAGQRLFIPMYRIVTVTEMPPA